MYVRSIPFGIPTYLFQTELAINTHTMVADIHRNVLKNQEGSCSQHHPVSCLRFPQCPSTHHPQTPARYAKIRSMRSTILRFHSIPPGELPPPPPWACFGRDQIIEEIIRLAEHFDPIALIGAAGIGKTSICLTILHHDRIKERFGDNRRFIRCDQFPATSAHLLGRLSKVIGAGIENPEDLTPLRPFLSSTKMVLFLDNAESILDPQGTEAREIYSVVEELSRFSNICLGITSRITTVPPRCKRPEIPALSMQAACDIFYSIYGGSERSEIINDLLQRLDFHALSITLLATAASHNRWGFDELAKEWNVHRARVLRTDYNESLSATIELSLASPTFLKLGPSARELLGVVAFFPQGVDKNNIDWLFPTIPDRKTILDKFCVLSLTHRNGNFITMLAPIRDYLCPRDPKSSPLLCATRDRYFSRLSVDLEPNEPGFGEARWIRSEDVNVEHLLDIFTSIDTNSIDVWDACSNFMMHLYWHRPRLVALRQKIEQLPDGHCFKPDCLFWLSLLLESVGNDAERKQLLTHLLKLDRARGDEESVARTLRSLSNTNRLLGLREEGIQQAREALEIWEQLGDTVGQAWCFNDLAFLLYDDGQLGAAGEAACRLIALLPEEGEELLVSRSHRHLGEIYRSTGDGEKAIHHFKTALGIASPFNWHEELFWVQYSLADLFLREDRLDDAYVHIERAKSHAIEGSAYNLGRAVCLQAEALYRQRRLGEAKSQAICALETFEKLGAADDWNFCRDMLQRIEGSLKIRVTSGEPDSSGEYQRIECLSLPERHYFEEC